MVKTIVLVEVRRLLLCGLDQLQSHHDSTPSARLPVNRNKYWKSSRCCRHFCMISYRNIESVRVFRRWCCFGRWWRLQPKAAPSRCGCSAPSLDSAHGFGHLEPSEFAGRGSCRYHGALPFPFPLPIPLLAVVGDG
jgi:hypothetical protein